MRRLAQTVVERRNALLPIVLQSRFDLLSAIDRIYAQLNLVNSLLEFSEASQPFENKIWKLPNPAPDQPGPRAKPNRYFTGPASANGRAGRAE